MKVLAVGASLSTLSMSYALRTVGFSVTVAERLSQMNFNKKLNVIAPQSWSKTSKKPLTVSANYFTNPSHFRSSQHLYKHSFANMSSMKTLRALRLNKDNNILKLPWRNGDTAFAPGRPQLSTVSLYERDGTLGTGGALEFIPNIDDILQKNNTCYDTHIEVTSVSKEQLTYRLYHQLRHLDSQCLAFSKRFVQAHPLGYNQGVEVEFEDGSKEIFDLIICGDAMAADFRKLLQQVDVPSRRRAVSAIVKKNLMRRPYDGLAELYCGNQKSFVVQRLNEELYKWTVTWMGDEWFDPSLGDYPAQLKQQALDAASQMSYGRDIVQETDTNLLFEDDFCDARYEPRTEKSAVTLPIVATGATAAGLFANNPFVDLSAHMSLKNAILFQEFAQKPHADFFKDVLLKYETYIADHQQQIQKQLVFMETYLHQSSMLDRLGMRVFRWGFKRNIQLFKDIEQRGNG